MIYLTIVFVFVWILAAALTLKVEALAINQPTDYGDWWLALLLWWLVAYWILTDKHAVYSGCGYEKVEYHY